MKRILNLTIILLVFAIISCSKKYDKEVVTIVKEWTGKKVSNIPLADCTFLKKVEWILH